MRQTQATKEALRRDRFRCQWCYYKLNRIRGVFDFVGHCIASGGGHHVFGRARVDEPDAIIGLCGECHTAVHVGNISKCEIIELMEKFVVKHDLRNKYRQFHDC